MHDRVIRQHSNDAPAQPLVTHAADALVANDHAPIAPALSALDAVTKKKEGLARDELGLAQPRDHAALVDRAVGGADAPAEVGLEIADGDGVRDEGEGGGCGEAGAVFGEEVEGGWEVGFVGVWWCEVEGEEGVIDGLGSFFWVLA